MVEVDIAYEGDLRCTATHGPSKTTLQTDAPVDNMGRGESFSPTDLLATALGSCMLTTMAINAQRLSIDLTGSSARVQKHMTAQPTRRVGELTVEIVVPTELSDEDRRRMKAAAMACPVHRSLHPDVKIPVTFFWGPGKVAEKLVESH
jgi:putative redox protein